MKSNSYAMEGEDVILLSLLRNKQGVGSYFDIGCSEPILNSNTFLFYQKGWRGLAVDGRDLTSQWEIDRSGDRFIHLLVGGKNEATDFWTFPDPTMNTADPDTADRYAQRFPSSEARRVSFPVRRAYDVWQENCTGENWGAPEIVSIDVEGFEMAVLKGLLEPDRSWRPAVLVVETKLFHFLNPLKNEIVSYLIEVHGYSLISKTPLNAFFIDPLNSLFNWLPPSMLTKK